MHSTARRQLGFLTQNEIPLYRGCALISRFARLARNSQNLDARSKIQSQFCGWFASIFHACEHRR